MNKVVTILKTEGIGYLLIKIVKYLYWHLIRRPINWIKQTFLKFYYKINIINKIKYSKRVKELFKNLKQVDRIMLWKNDNFGWNVDLFQRPQHLARIFASNKTLYLYEVNNTFDNVDDFKNIKDNLYLINNKNSLFLHFLYKKLDKIQKVKYLHIYSTELNLKVSEMKNFIKKGYKVLYEYIDDLSPEISGSEKLPENILKKYEFVMKHPNCCEVVVTADNIEKDVLQYRTQNQYVFSSNGVDYDHFINLTKKIKLNKKMQDIVNEKKPIIGYYGALATWFDYDLLRYLATKRKNYNIVLIGPKYDDEYDKHKLDKLDNIHLLGSINYEKLPYYAKHFTVCTIPFLINDITQATSPLKLFEYMALAKPIVTTAMHECKKYESVMIAKNKDEYVKLIDQAIELSNTKDKQYYSILKKEALDNSWKNKGKLIIDYLEKKERSIAENEKD